MAVRVVARVQVDQAQVRALVQGQGSPVWEGLSRVGARTRDRAKLKITAAGRVDTGQLRNQVESEVSLRGDEVVARITSRAAHTMYVHDGTTGPIMPRRARVLRFKPRGATAFVFTPQVDGIAATPFLTDALDELSIDDLMG